MVNGAGLNLAYIHETAAAAADTRLYLLFLTGYFMIPQNSGCLQMHCFSNLWISRVSLTVQKHANSFWKSDTNVIRYNVALHLFLLLVIDLSAAHQCKLNSA